MNQTHVAWSDSKGVPGVASPLFYNGQLYTFQNGGIVNARVAKTGELLYTGRLGAPGYYYSSPDGDRLLGWQVNQGRGHEGRYIRSDQLKRYLWSPELVRRAIVLRSAEAAIKEMRPGVDKELQKLLERKPPEFDVRVAADQSGVRDGFVAVEISGAKEAGADLADLSILSNSRNVGSFTTRSADGGETTAKHCPGPRLTPGKQDGPDQRQKQTGRQHNAGPKRRVGPSGMPVTASNHGLGQVQRSFQTGDQQRNYDGLPIAQTSQAMTPDRLGFRDSPVLPQGLRNISDGDEHDDSKFVKRARHEARELGNGNDRVKRQEERQQSHQPQPIDQSIDCGLQR